jgi:hypothetical protein
LDLDLRVLAAIIAAAVLAAQLLWFAARAVWPERSVLTREEAADLRGVRDMVQELRANVHDLAAEQAELRRAIQSLLHGQQARLDSLAELLRLILEELRRRNGSAR